MVALYGGAKMVAVYGVYALPSVGRGAVSKNICIPKCYAVMDTRRPPEAMMCVYAGVIT